MDKVERRLTAIMFTDIVGYSALTGRDEMLAMELLQEHHALLRGVFARHGGSEVKTIGDSFMLEFSSVVNAVSCAIDMQQTLADRNQTEEPARQILIRIGVHAGDVIFRDGDVFGEGVNIASRIEPLAQPGGICVSEDVARQIRNKIAFPVSELGSAELKNIDLPMKVCSIQSPWLTSKAVASPSAGDKARLTVPRPSRAWWKWGVAAAALLLVVGGALVMVGGLGEEPVGGELVSGVMSSVEGTQGDRNLDPEAIGSSSLEATRRPRAAAAPAVGEVRNAAKAAFDSGTFPEAIEQYQTLVRLAPRDADAFYHLGRSFAFTNDADQAVANLTKASSLQDDSSLYHIHLGLALEEAEQFDEAIAQLQRGLELGGHPDFTEGDLAARVGRLEARVTLATLVPFTAPGKHDHLIGSCAGTLSMTDESFAFVVTGDHAFNVWLADVSLVDATGDKLAVELGDGKKFNFELTAEERARFGQIYELLKIL